MSFPYIYAIFQEQFLLFSKHYIANNPLMAAIGWFATIIALVLSIVIPIISRKKKSLTFEYDTTVLVEAQVAKAENIQVLFNEKPIEKLSVTKFKIFNSGNTIVKGTEMYEGHKLIIVGAGFDIVSAEIEDLSRGVVARKDHLQTINGNRKELGKTIDLSDKSLSKITNDTVLGIIPIEFNVFERKDYIIINIYHSGDQDAVFQLSGIGEELRIHDGNVARQVKEYLRRGNGPSYSAAVELIKLITSDGFLL